MDNSESNDDVFENDIWEAMSYINELFEEFGILHPLVKESLKELARLVANLVENQEMSPNLRKTFFRFLDRYKARYSKALEQQQQQQVSLQNQNNIKEESSVPWLGLAVTGVALFAGAAALAYWLRPSKPTQFFHHYSGQITDNINLNCSGHITEDINLNVKEKLFF